jgi:hypothetical protein
VTADFDVSYDAAGVLVFAPKCSKDLYEVTSYSSISLSVGLVIGGCVCLWYIVSAVVPFQWLNDLRSLDHLR